MLTSIRYKNFKSFQDTGDIQIKPITLIVGPNSSGKTSLIQPLLMIKQTVESRERIINSVKTSGDYVDLGSFRDFVYMGEDEREVEIESHSFLAQPLPF